MARGRTGETLAQRGLRVGTSIPFGMAFTRARVRRTRTSGEQVVQHIHDTIPPGSYTRAFTRWANRWFSPLLSVELGGAYGLADGLELGGVIGMTRVGVELRTGVLGRHPAQLVALALSAGVAKQVFLDPVLLRREHYEIRCEIRHGDSLIATGAYNSTSGLHAEMDALNNCPVSTAAVLIVGLAPCKRCAAVLAHYCRGHRLTIRAPDTRSQGTYSGAYRTPECAAEIIIGGLVRANVVTMAEAEHHRREILSQFASGSWLW